MFDFKAVRRHMKTSKWKWWNEKKHSYCYPSVDELKAEAEDLLLTVGEAGFICSTAEGGGFLARISGEEGLEELGLLFYVTNRGTYLC